MYVAADAVMVADPGASPVTCGAVDGCVAPAAIVTVEGEIETIAGLLLESATVTPLAGAGAGKVIWNGADLPRPTDTFEGNPIVPALLTVMLVVALDTFGVVVLAVMVVVPTLTPVTATVTEVAP